MENPTLNDSITTQDSSQSKQIDSSMNKEGTLDVDRKIFVGGLPWNTTEEILQSYFEQFGDIEHVSIMKEKLTKRPRGFAFVTFVNDSSVKNALAHPEHMLEEKRIDIKKAIPRNEVTPVFKTRKMFVGGIHPSVTDDQLHEYFTSFGMVRKIQIMRDKATGKSRGFGFVTFKDYATAKKVEHHKDHFLLKKMEVKPAEPKKLYDPSKSPYPFSDYVIYPYYIDMYGSYPSDMYTFMDVNNGAYSEYGLYKMDYSFANLNLDTHDSEKSSAQDTDNIQEK